MSLHLSDNEVTRAFGEKKELMFELLDSFGICNEDLKEIGRG